MSDETEEFLKMQLEREVSWYKTYEQGFKDAEKRLRDQKKRVSDARRALRDYRRKPKEEPRDDAFDWLEGL